MRCDGKIALVSGAGSGMGRATALVFAENGAKVAVVAHDMIKANETVEMITSLGGEALPLAFDITDSAECRRVVGQTIEHFGDLDIVANTAGFNDPGFFMEQDEAYWEYLIRLNLFGSILLTRAAL